MEKIMDLKKVFSENVDLSSLFPSTGNNLSKQAVEEANFRLKNPIDLNVVGFDAVFPVCHNVNPKRTAFGLTRLEHFRRDYTSTVSLSFDEIVQLMTKFVAETPTLTLHISPACTAMTLIHEDFSCDLAFYIDDLDAKQVSYEVRDHSVFNMCIRRSSGTCVLFYKNESRFYDLLQNAELARHYIAGTYKLPLYKLEPINLGFNKSLSFDDLQKDFI